MNPPFEPAKGGDLSLFGKKKAITVGRIKTYNMDHPVVYTVGHSTHHLDHFLELIREHGVNCIIDVRSVGASSHNPQYNQETLRNFLKNTR